MDTQKPEPPPEAVLIKEALRRSRLSGREAARRAGLGETRWRQIVNGYQDVGGGVRVPTVAPAETLARMAQVVGVTPDQLRGAGRADAADALVELLQAQPSPASATGPHGSDPRVDAIATLLADLPPEAQAEVLRRFTSGELAAPTKEVADRSDRHRHAS
ncbi:helix-turn-helix domain-containing protein [Streptomyces echinoruber]|uniref:helix-turn-helix domain-containing protein n=1 Tax=Streptomyces echinoruber TaxID=68898 RepID=UPI00167556A0|nr:helix-turn-helix transcriptional regulator [Streptomyces echinoruber]